MSPETAGWDWYPELQSLVEAAKRIGSIEAIELPREMYRKVVGDIDTDQTREHGSIVRLEDGKPRFHGHLLCERPIDAPRVTVTYGGTLGAGWKWTVGQTTGYEGIKVADAAEWANDHPEAPFEPEVFDRTIARLDALATRASARHDVGMSDYTPRDIEARNAHNFAHHPPSAESMSTHQTVNDELLATANRIVDLTPAGREQSVALTKLEEVMFWANAAMARA